MGGFLIPNWERIENTFKTTRSSILSVIEEGAARLTTEQQVVEMMDFLTGRNCEMADRPVRHAAEQTRTKIAAREMDGQAVAAILAMIRYRVERPISKTNHTEKRPCISILEQKIPFTFREAAARRYVVMNRIEAFATISLSKSLFLPVVTDPGRCATFFRPFTNSPTSRSDRIAIWRLSHPECLRSDGAHLSGEKERWEKSACRRGSFCPFHALRKVHRSLAVSTNR
jgi:hypothetical protein